MIRLLAVGGGLLGTVIGTLSVFVVVLVSPFLPVSSAPSGMGSGKQQVIVAHAELLQEHIWGNDANYYDAHDPVMAPAYQFWLKSCGYEGVVCQEAQSGNLQCVMFVSGVFFLSGATLPVLDDAQNLWPLYQQRPGWREIPVKTGYPRPGDVIVWQGGRYGHVAVVVRVVEPTTTRNGSVTVAQANAPGNRWDASQLARPGNFYTMPLFLDGSLPRLSEHLSVLGYIRYSGL